MPPPSKDPGSNLSSGPWPTWNTAMWDATTLGHMSPPGGLFIFWGARGVVYCFRQNRDNHHATHNIRFARAHKLFRGNIIYFDKIVKRKRWGSNPCEKHQRVLRWTARAKMCAHVHARGRTPISKIGQNGTTYNMYTQGSLYQIPAPRTAGR